MVTNAYLYNGYTVTRNFVKNINACRKCGYRLYAKDDQQVRTGNGNINGNAVIVVRNANDAIILDAIFPNLLIPLIIPSNVCFNSAVLKIESIPLSI